MKLRLTARELDQIIGKNLKRNREGMQLSTEEVARFLEMSEGQYICVEAGEISLSPYELFRASLYFLTPVACLMRRQ